MQEDCTIWQKGVIFIKPKFNMKTDIFQHLINVDKFLIFNVVSTSIYNSKSTQETKVTTLCACGEFITYKCFVGYLYIIHITCIYMYFNLRKRCINGFHLRYFRLQVALVYYQLYIRSETAIPHGLPYHCAILYPQ